MEERTKLSMMPSLTLPSPLGVLTITSDGQAITSVAFGKQKSSKEKTDKVLLQCRKELKEYFGGRRQKFSVAISPQGTDFQRIIWREMLRVPYGKTISYSELSKRIGKPKAMRATGSACGRNPIVILIPCHRIIASGSGIGGYSGGLEKKRWLLEHEKKFAQTQTALTMRANA